MMQGAEPVGGCSSQLSLRFLLSSPPSPPAAPRVEEGSHRPVNTGGPSRSFGGGWISYSMVSEERLVALWILKCMLSKYMSLKG